MHSSQRRVTLAVASIAVLVAFAIPAGASAAVWGVPGASRSLNSATVVTTIGAPSELSWQCSQHLGLKLRTPASATSDVTSATFSNCIPTHGTGIMGCTITETAANLPWTLQALTTSNVTLNVGNINVKIAGGCPWASEFKMSGSIAQGVWNASKHSLTYQQAARLSAPFTPDFATITAIFVDPENLLTLF
jgi:hypothetical protein